MNGTNVYGFYNFLKKKSVWFKIQVSSITHEKKCAIILYKWQLFKYKFYNKLQNYGNLDCLIVYSSKD